MPHALDAGHAVLDGLGDQGFKLGGCCAELRDRARDHRNIGARKPGDGELGEDDPAKHQEDDREYHRGEGITDRPRGDIQSHCRTRARSRSSANVVLIRSPSCNEVPASATTISPTSMPSRISVEVSDTRPTFTFRVSTMSPLTTWTVRWSMAARGTAMPQLRLASMLARGNIPTFKEGLFASEMRTCPSWVLRLISGKPSRTRPIRSGVPSLLIRVVAPGLSFSM